MKTESLAMAKIIDLNFLSIEEAIGVFLLKTSEGPILIETGPYSTFETLKSKLTSEGVDINDIKHVFLTHIHLDHAGAAWAFAELGATIYMHPFGAPHLIDPTKLLESATRIYGDKMDVLWSEVKAIPESRVHTVGHLEEFKIGETLLVALHTPGHAKHHIAWQINDEIFCGDVAGVKIANGPVVPPCPPPDINIEDWIASIDFVLARNPSKIHLTHFGEQSDLLNHMSELKIILGDWSRWIKKKWEEGLDQKELVPLFSEYTTNQLLEKGVSQQGVQQYEAANPSWMSVAGLIRYWKKKASQ